MFPMTPLSILLMAVVFIAVIVIFAICIRRELR
jgi:hypothetical protein